MRSNTSSSRPTLVLTLSLLALLATASAQVRGTPNRLKTQAKEYWHGLHNAPSQKGKHKLVPATAESYWFEEEVDQIPSQRYLKGKSRVITRARDGMSMGMSMGMSSSSGRDDSRRSRRMRRMRRRMRMRMRSSSRSSTSPTTTGTNTTAAPTSPGTTLVPTTASPTTPGATPVPTTAAPTTATGTTPVPTTAGPTTPGVTTLSPTTLGPTTTTRSAALRSAPIDLPQKKSPRAPLKLVEILVKDNPTQGVADLANTPTTEIGVGTAIRTGGPIRTIDLASFDPSTVTADESIGVLPVASRMVLTFFPGKGRQPTTTEIDALVQATKAYFAQVFRNNPQFSPAFDDFSMTQITPLYSPRTNPDEFALEFLALVLVDALSNTQTGNQALQVMSKSSWKDYLRTYLSQSDSGWNEFYETSVVHFKGASHA